MRILVTGAGGFIGRHLVPELLSRGHEVLALPRAVAAPIRGATMLDPWPELATIPAWPGWPAGVEAVVHLAAQNPSRREASAADAAGLDRLNREGTRVLAERAAREGVRRFVFLSTANVHQPAGTRPVGEDEPVRPQSLYAQSKWAAEEALRAIASGGAMAMTILRPVPVYGAGSRGGIALLMRLAASGLPLPFADAGNLRSLLAIENCVDAIRAVLEAPAAANQTFLLADERPVSTGEIVRWVRLAKGRPARLFPAPIGALRPVARLAGRSEDFERLYGSFVVDTSRIRERLGWRAPVSTAAAIAAAAHHPFEPGATSR